MRAVLAALLAFAAAWLPRAALAQDAAPPAIAAAATTSDALRIGVMTM